MLRRALLVTPLLLLGCASARTSPVIVGDAASAVEAPAAPAAATGAFTDFAPGSRVGPMAPPRRPRQRFTLKGGYYGSSEDGLDDGYIVNAAWMRPTSDRLSSELEIGYLDASGTEKGVERDVWSIPLLVNGRFDLPVGKKVELYGGLGLGSFYYEADAKTLGVSVSADGFVFGGDAFFGGAIHLGKTLLLGLEGKYYLTDSASDLDGSLDAYVVMLTLGFDQK